MEVYLSGEFSAVKKADDSPLTLADQRAHVVIAEHLGKTGIPVLSEEMEQQDYESRSSWPWYWLVDPLDGTKEFLKRNGEFTVNIALMHHSKPVGGVIFAPVLNTLYYGTAESGAWKESGEEKVQLQEASKRLSIEALLQKTGVRVIASRSHLTPETKAYVEQLKAPAFVTMGSSLKFMLLAENKADIYPRFAPTMEWDTAAAHAILRVLNKGIYQTDLRSELAYNKKELLNPSFISF